MSRRIDDGVVENWWMMVRQSSRADLRSGVMLTYGGFPRSALYIGEKRPFPPGIAKEACCSLPATF